MIFVEQKVAVANEGTLLQLGTHAAHCMLAYKVVGDTLVEYLKISEDSVLLSLKSL